MVKTTIQIQDTTVKKLKRYARKDETYDEFLIRLLKQAGLEK